MKRILLSILLLLSFSAFIGCDKTIASTTTRIQTQTEDTLETEGYVVEMLTYDEPLFEAEISDITIDVVTMKINFHVEIADYSSMYAYYFVYGYESKNFRPFHLISSNDKAASMDVSLNLYYDEVYPIGYMTVEMGRYRDSLSVNQEHPESNSVGFRYRLNSMNDRSHIEDIDVRFGPNYDTETIYNHEGIVTISYDDPNHIINQLKIKIFDLYYDLKFIREVVVDVDDLMFDGDHFYLQDTFFRYLSPNVRYEVKVYASGNDGVYNFTDKFIGRGQAEIYHNDRILTAHHDFYCMIETSRKINDVTHIDLYVANEGFYLINDEIPVLYLDFYHDEADTSPYLRVDLDNAFNNLQLGNTEIQIYDLIRVENEDRSVILYETSVFPE